MGKTVLTSLNIRNFRGISQLTINPLGRINLIAGKNGAGKTGVLESLWILSGPDIPELASRVSIFRGLPPPNAGTIFVDLFNGFDIDSQIEIIGGTEHSSRRRKLTIHMDERSSPTTKLPRPSGNPVESDWGRSTQFLSEGRYELVFEYLDDNGREYESRAWYIEQTLGAQPQMPVPIAFTNTGVSQARDIVPGRPTSVLLGSHYRSSLEEDANNFGELQLKGIDGEILAVLRTLEPRLQSITPILINNAPIMYANIREDRPIAARLLGEGFNRTFSIAVSMGLTRGGMLLIDEIENGLHHSVMKDIFAQLFELAVRFDVQVVASTHSAECISAAYGALGHGNSEDFTFHRIDRVDGQSKATYFDGDMLETAMLHEMEVR